MPAQCAICGKQRRVANNVSHSNIKTKSIQRPNLRRVRAKLLAPGAKGPTNRRIRVCTRCLRSGAVLKAG
jgi:large subunit ribosomal protein L28